MKPAQHKAPEHHNHHLFSLVVAFAAILAALSIYTYLYTHNSTPTEKVTTVGTGMTTEGTLPDTPTDTLSLTGTVKENANRSSITVRILPIVGGVVTERYVRVAVTDTTGFYALGSVPTTVASVRGASPSRTKTAIDRTKVTIGSTVQISIAEPLAVNPTPTAKEIDVL